MDIFVNTKICRIYFLFLVCFAALIPAQASAYGVRYDYYVFSRSGDPSNPSGPPKAGSAILTGETSVSGIVSMTGSELGNNAMVRFYANLATGSIGSYAYAKGFDDGYTSTGRVEQIGFTDTLHFAIPAGTYDNGVTVSLNGRVTGTLSATQYAGAKAGYTVSFGGNSVSKGPSTLIIGVDETGLIDVDDPFSLSVDLVSPGTTLASAEMVNLSLLAQFNDHETWTTEQTSATLDYTAIAETDFYNSIGFTSVDTPAGITWTSDSGVFLSAVPIPAAGWLMATGLLGLLGVARRRRH